MAQLAQELQQKQQVCSMYVASAPPGLNADPSGKGLLSLACTNASDAHAMLRAFALHVSKEQTPDTILVAAVLSKQLLVAPLVPMALQQEALYSMASQLSAANQHRNAQAMQFGGLPLYQSANIPMMSPFPGALSALQQVRHCIPVTALILMMLALTYYKLQGVGSCMSHQVFTAFSMKL